ncbi:hypothetical protein GmRootV59_22940 [Variovorax sp. V59]
MNRPLIVPPRVALTAVEGHLPFERRSIHRMAREGRVVWLSKVSPEGRPSREWWVDVPQMLEYFGARGCLLQLEVKGQKG